MEAKRVSKDLISTLPSILIEDILCRVPIRDAVRTSILSRNWRYNWATIPKLMFNEYDMFKNSNQEHQLEQPGNGRKQLTRKYNVFYDINQVLLLHKGPILEFTLSMRRNNKTCPEIDQIILYLSRNTTIEKLTLDLECYFSIDLYKLPLSIFSLHQLKDLSLSCCEFEFNPTLGGFSSLTSLSLNDVETSSEALTHLIFSCPLLKHFSLMSDEYGVTLDLKELFKCLFEIEHLSINSRAIEFSAPQDLPATLLHLKSLSMSWMLFVNKFKLFALFSLIRSSPNLEKIEIQGEDVDYDIDLTDPKINSLDDYSDIWLEHLHDLEINDFESSTLGLKFVKLILAKSPVLKRVRIVLDRCVQKDEELKMLRILLRCPRASTVAEIVGLSTTS